MASCLSGVGSLAIMGEGIISSHVYKGAVKNGTDVNTAAAVGTHTRTMEGLLARGDGSENYGGNNDDYDAGHSHMFYSAMVDRY